MPLLRSRLTIYGLFWGLSVLAGFVALAQYQNNPGPVSSAPAVWPGASGLVQDDKRLDLLMFLHPHCPCSRASLRELERVMARSRDRLRIRLLFVQPAGAGDAWAATELRATAESLPGVEVLVDHDAVEAHHFGATTSGQCHLFSGDGALLFAGGITASRAHEGDNLGSLAILSIAAGAEPDRRETAVYGCGLFDQSETTKPGDSTCCQQY